MWVLWQVSLMRRVFLEMMLGVLKLYLDLSDFVLNKLEYNEYFLPCV